MLKSFVASEEKDLFQQIVLLRMVAFEKYEHNQEEKDLDNKCTQYVLLEQEEVIATFRLLISNDGKVIQKLCADKSGRFKGAGARLVEEFKKQTSNQKICTNCYIKLAGFWQKLGFEPTGRITGEKQDYELKQ